MNVEVRIDRDRIEERRKRETLNVFSRLPAVYAASRRQGQLLLKIGGGLSIVEWRTLWDLHEVGPATVGDLAAIQRADHSLLSRALPQMRRKGLVTMQRASGDARRSVVALTDKGRAAYARAAPVMARRRAALRETFTDEEIHVFVDMLERLEEFLRLPVNRIARPEDAE